MITIAESEVYTHPKGLYTDSVGGFTLGDVIRKARRGRGWNQERLGEEAEYFPLGLQTKAIDKGTVSKVERDPYGSKFGTVWRLLAALNLSLADAERDIGTLDRRQESGSARRDHPVAGTR